MHASHSHGGYPYPVARPMDHRDEAPPHHSQHSLPPLFNRETPESGHYYPESRRPSLNPSMNGSQALKLPQPHPYETYSGPRPQPLELQFNGPFSATRGRGYETPMPHTPRLSSALPVGQRSLPAYHALAEPGGVPSPYSRTAQTPMEEMKETNRTLLHNYPVDQPNAKDSIHLGSHVDSGYEYTPYKSQIHETSEALLPDDTGTCSTFSVTFANAQEFYKHLDDASSVSWSKPTPVGPSSIRQT
ncbi:hypothetical protein K469DRAFT_264679 [Zopfia rhizophila CBS 207.26]|uniref:Uncharacterized protein n=1 Tax=Zopfia rhizophila CBS 207.26 TaxID=1314779 RepID=A0A6A6DPZ2_9PEZI|nr:hypothetical protein K469DRAFT_264679 [Zopfia rhizophila CBS 207.26]